MKTKIAISKYALLIGLIGVLPYSANSAIRVKSAGNSARSYADGYSQVNNKINAQYADYADGADAARMGIVNPDNMGAPVRVANPQLVEKIQSNAGAVVSDEQMERCNRIYPEGEFEWSNPTAGAARGAGRTCVSFVEMRALNAAPDGSDLVLARTTLAAGDSLKCNISAFPEESYTEDAGKFLFPADKEPTVDDVVKVLNQEQKQNAVFKIAAGALIGGVGGNMAGKNDYGKEGLLGTGKGKMQGTAIGAVLGAGVAAAGAYSGKVAGDTIVSTSVNAAAGGIIGNVMATGDDVLRVEKCTLPGTGDSADEESKSASGGRETTCLFGYVAETSEVKSVSLTDAQTQESAVAYYYDYTTGSVYVCSYQLDNNTYSKKILNADTCRPIELINLVFDNGLSLEDVKKKGWDYIDKYKKECLDTNANKQCTISGQSDKNGNLIRIDYAEEVKRKEPAAIIDFKDKTMGHKSSDWDSLKKNYSDDKIFKRDGHGRLTMVDSKDKDKYQIKNFKPITVKAEDGGIIDLSNKARMKATVTGAGVGGALGAMSGYQGAQNDIQERYLAAMQEYRDSLGKVYCATGKRWLSSYNDVVTIPEMQ